jgi:hypothetical protein
MRLGVLVSALLVMASNAHADMEEMGLGIQPCAKFAKTFQADPDVTEGLYISWAVGFMTGLNIAAAANKTNMRNLGAMPFEEQKRFMLKFCGQYPLKEYMSGVIELYQSLPTAQQAR